MATAPHGPGTTRHRRVRDDAVREAVARAIEPLDDVYGVEVADGTVDIEDGHTVTDERNVETPLSVHGKR
jgi:flavin-binding protein dodecin